MRKEKQIDEMLNEICTNCTYLLVCEDEHLKQVCRFAKMTKVLYDAGYRKQEWISVHDRLPKSDARVLVYMHENRMSYTRIDTDRVVQGKWVRWESFVTHWMPLPEPPKMKGAKS